MARGPSMCPEPGLSQGPPGSTQWGVEPPASAPRSTSADFCRVRLPVVCTGQLTAGPDRLPVVF